MYKSERKMKTTEPSVDEVGPIKKAIGGALPAARRGKPVLLQPKMSAKPSPGLPPEAMTARSAPPMVMKKGGEAAEEKAEKAHPGLKKGGKPECFKDGGFATMCSGGMAGFKSKTKGGSW